MEKSFPYIHTFLFPYLWRKPGSGLLLVFLLFTSIDTYAQKKGQELIDSLKTELKTVKADTSKVNILNGLSEHAGWRINQNDTCIYYAKNALQLAKKLNFKKGEARSYNNMANAYAQNYDRQKALKNYISALKIYTETGDKDWQSMVYNNIAITYSEQAEYSKALENYNASLKLTKETDNRHVTANALYGIGRVYYRQGKYSKALENYSDALKIYEENGNKREIVGLYLDIGAILQLQGNLAEGLQKFYTVLKIGEEIQDKHAIASAYGNIGTINKGQGDYPKALENYKNAFNGFKETGNKYGMVEYSMQIGGIYLLMKDYPQALDNFSYSLKLSNEIGYEPGTAFVYGYTGDVHKAQGNYQEALKSYFKAVEIFEKLGERISIAYGYKAIGEAYVNLNQPQEGKIWLQKGLELSKEMKATNTIKEAYEGLSKADSASGNFKGAYANYKLFTLYKDSIYNEENTKKLTQVEMQYEFDKKEAMAQAAQEKKDFLAREALAKAKSNRNLAIAGVGVFMFVAVFLGIGYRQKRKSNRIISKEKQKSDDLLLNILPEEVAAELKTTGTSEAKHFDSVSIMFTDFKDFTKHSEKISSKELIQELNHCFKAFDKIITQHGIEKIKTIGDAYMAVCGLPVPQDNHAKKMIEAALEIRDFMENYEQKRTQEGKSFFEMRIGINSGEVVAGIVGIKKFAYDIWGDAVNIAARMESNGEVGKINISESTHNLVKNDFNFEYRGEIKTKGKGKINMYFAEPKNRL